ncbi:MAG: lipoyl(octanoyl) transferase LipB [Planctomycetota bacterium]
MSTKNLTTHPDALVVEDLGRLAYGPALERQRTLNEAVIAGDAPPTVLLVEHDPVITLTRRKDVASHLIATPEQLAAAGVSTHETDRGGDITYHGPGQLVVYPILKLGDFGLNLSKYMRMLERAVIDTAGQWGIVGHNECGATGVWVAGEMADGGWRMSEGGNCSAKLCAMGVRIRRNTTLHGLALNVTTDLDHFKLIVPCGLHGRPVTSMRALLGDACPPMTEVKRVLVEKLQANLALGRGGATCG